MLTAKKRYEFKPDYAIAPGETLKEVMESLNMTQKELAVRTGLTVQSLNRIFKGSQPITYETANKLELATGVPARMWNNLEAQYREQIAKIKERKQLETDLDWLRSIPTKELIKRGAIAPQKDKVLLLRETLKFYGVCSVAAWEEIWLNPAASERRSRCFEKCPGPASAWIRLGEIQAHETACNPFNKPAFLRTTKKIRILMKDNPEDFIPEIRALCANSGVALALVPGIREAPWRGATKWLSSNKAMILLNPPGKTEDQFWFSFFHEAGHLLHDSKKNLYINDGIKNDPRERKADDFALRILSFAA